MKPCGRKARKQSSAYRIIALPSNGVMGSINGVIKKLGVVQANSMVALYLKRDLSPVDVALSNSSGEYDFKGLPKNEVFFIVGFDQSKQYNAVIQDSVVPV